MTEQRVEQFDKNKSEINDRLFAINLKIRELVAKEKILEEEGSAAQKKLELVSASYESL